VVNLLKGENMRANNFTYLDIFKKLVKNPHCNNQSTMSVFIYLLENYSFFEFKIFHYNDLIKLSDEVVQKPVSDKTIQNSLKKLAKADFINFTTLEKLNNKEFYNKIDPDSKIAYNAAFIKISNRLLLGKLPTFYHFYVYQFYVYKNDLRRLREQYLNTRTYETITMIHPDARKAIFEDFLAIVSETFYSFLIKYLAEDEKVFGELYKNNKIRYRDFKEQRSEFRESLGIKNHFTDEVYIKDFLKDSNLSSDIMYDDMYQLITNENDYNRLIEEIRRLEENIYSW